MLITPFYAAVLALLYSYLSVRTLKLRRKLKIAVGDGGNSNMLRAMRAHANFAEYVPFTLLLIFLLETLTGFSLLVHALGFSLLIGRLVHAHGVSRTPEDFRYRVTGMTLTFVALGGAALVVFAGYLMAFIG